MPDAPEHDGSMTLIAHLTELRARLLRCVLAVMLSFSGLVFFSKEIYSAFSEPLRRFLPEGSGMIATAVFSPFMTPFKLTLLVSVFAAIPYVLYQIWAFIAPGLYQHEKRIAGPMLAASILLFYAGAAFAYFLVLPAIFSFLPTVTPEGVAMMTDINEYFDFVLTMFFAFGVVFEVPVLVVMLIWTGIATPEGMAEKRPYVIVGCFAIGMVLTPPDPISQTLLAVPMCLLFEAGLLAGRLLHRRSEDPASEEDPDEHEEDHRLLP